MELCYHMYRVDRPPTRAKKSYRVDTEVVQQSDEQSTVVVVLEAHRVGLHVSPLPSLSLLVVVVAESQIGAVREGLVRREVEAIAAIHRLRV